MAAATSMSRRADESQLQLPCLLTGSWGCLRAASLGTPLCQSQDSPGLEGMGPPPLPCSAMCTVWGGSGSERPPKTQLRRGPALLPCTRGHAEAVGSVVLQPSRWTGVQPVPPTPGTPLKGSPQPCGKETSEET